MASVEKPIIDAFELVYPQAKDGPAGEFVKAAERTDLLLGVAVALTEYVSLERKGLNPYRADLHDKVSAAEFYASVSDNELDATRSMLGLVTAIRNHVRSQAVKASEARGGPIEIVRAGGTKNGQEKIEEKVDPK